MASKVFVKVAICAQHLKVFRLFGAQVGIGFVVHL
jgi:hypothetical protein